MRLSCDTLAEDPSVGMVFPFVLLLLCIALMPFVAKHFWEKYYPHVSVGLGFIVFLYYAIAFKGYGVLRMFCSILDYVSFMALVGSLFVIAGGIHIDISGHGSPQKNVLILACGAVLANLIGTTGASMLLIRPFIRINKSRVQSYHVMFFIFIVSNCGGVLTPLGDPPLFLGYLQGVPFFWLLSQPRIVGAWLFCVGMLLIIFFCFDYYHFKKGISYQGSLQSLSVSADDIKADEDEDEEEFAAGKEKLAKDGKRVQIDDDDEEQGGGKDDQLLVPGQQLASHTKQPIHVLGARNFAFLAAIVTLVLVQKAGFLVDASQSSMGAATAVSLVISGLMFATGFAAYRFGDKAAQEANSFSFGAIKEVGLLFIGIFCTMVPALDLLQIDAGKIDLTSPRAFYWSSGALSSVLDNAPTYLSFMAAARGLSDPQELLDVSQLLSDPEFVKRLIGVSLGSVFFGANTYIGNGPNFMVKSLAEEGGAKCPTFVEYVYKFSGPILLPIFLIVSFMCVES